MLKNSHAIAGSDAPAQDANGRHRTARTGRARTVIDRPPPLMGWRTTDEDEVALRRWRGPHRNRRHRGAGTRAADFRHVPCPLGERQLLRGRDPQPRWLQSIPAAASIIAPMASAPASISRACSRPCASATRQAFREAASRRHCARRGFPGSPRRRNAGIDRGPPADRRRANAASRLARSFLEPDGTLACDPGKVQALVSAWRVGARRQSAAGYGCRAISRRGSIGGAGSARAERPARRSSPRSSTALRVSICHAPLLPYQREGMLHLAFGERALLADEMGLGKTVQAIAACELLARRKGIERVLVVCPASLKAEWEEQIARFTDRPAQVRVRAAAGAPCRLPRAQFLHHRELRAGARRRRGHQRRYLRPDVVVLDEAQRIKNWQTKTARRVKSAALALCLRADRHAAREPDRRALLDRAVPRPGAGRAAVPLQPRLLRARRARPAGRLQEPRRVAPPVATGDAPPPQVRCRVRTPGPHGEDLLRADGRGAAAPLRGLPRAGGPSPRPGAAAAVDPEEFERCKCCSPACA